MKKKNPQQENLFFRCKVKPFSTRKRHFLSFCSALLLLSLMLSGCGEPDTLTAYDVKMVVESDCRQVGQGAVQCQDEEELQKLQISGRWILDERDGRSFLLNTEDGRVLPGILFKNDGNVAVTQACLGERGGNCYYARSEEASYDVESACSQTNQHIVDAVKDEEGNLTGFMFYTSFTDEGCVNSFISERRIQVIATPADEVVLARKEFQ